jgi:hypothetical protein
VGSDAVGQDGACVLKDHGWVDERGVCWDGSASRAAARAAS